jgi:hypothetical protein
MISNREATIIGKRREVVRILLALLLLMFALTASTVNGCKTPGSKVEEEITMTEKADSLAVSNMTEGYKTATFALG